MSLPTLLLLTGGRQTAMTIKKQLSFLPLSVRAGSRPRFFLPSLSTLSTSTTTWTHAVSNSIPMRRSMSQTSSPIFNNNNNNNNTSKPTILIYTSPTTKLMTFTRIAMRLSLFLNTLALVFITPQIIVPLQTWLSILGASMGLPVVGAWYFSRNFVTR
jgi:hypothetical protein